MRLLSMKKETAYNKSSVSLNLSHGNYLKTLMNTTFMSNKRVMLPSNQVRIALIVFYLKNSWLTKMLSKPLTGDTFRKCERNSLLQNICRLRECWLLPDYPLIMLMLFLGSKFTNSFVTLVLIDVFLY